MSITMNLNDYVEKIAELEKQIAELKAVSVVSIEPEKKHEPRIHGAYYYLNSRGTVVPAIWSDSEEDLQRLAMGSVYDDEESAEFAAERLKVLAEMRKYSGKWNDRYHIIYHDCYMGVVPTSASYGEIKFATEEAGEDCIKDIGYNRLKKYYFGVTENEK